MKCQYCNRYEVEPRAAHKYVLPFVNTRATLGVTVKLEILGRKNCPCLRCQVDAITKIYQSLKTDLEAAIKNNTQEKIRSLPKKFKMVRGVTYIDGIPYRRWITAYKKGLTWFSFDTSEIVSDVDDVLEIAEFNSMTKVA